MPEMITIAQRGRITGWEEGLVPAHDAAEKYLSLNVNGSTKLGGFESGIVQKCELDNRRRAGTSPSSQPVILPRCATVIISRITDQVSRIRYHVSPITDH